MTKEKPLKFWKRARPDQRKLETLHLWNPSGHQWILGEITMALLGFSRIPKDFLLECRARGQSFGWRGLSLKFRRAGDTPGWGELRKGEVFQRGPGRSDPWRIQGIRGTGWSLGGFWKAGGGGDLWTGLSLRWSGGLVISWKSLQRALPVPDHLKSLTRPP